MTAIQDKFEFLRAEVVDLGEALSEEEDLEDGGARQARLFGNLYFHPRIGEAFECHGLILEKYVELGEQFSGPGYPLTDEQDDPNVFLGRRNDFEGGSIAFDPAVGISVMYDELPLVPQVVVKVTDDVDVPIDKGMSMSLADLGAIPGLSPDDPVLAAIFVLVPGPHDPAAVRRTSTTPPWTGWSKRPCGRTPSGGRRGSGTTWSSTAPTAPTPSWSPTPCKRSGSCCSPTPCQ